MSTPPNWPTSLAMTVAQVKREISADIRAGTVPPTVRSFAELHDYVDANEYGGATDCWYEGCAAVDGFVAFWNTVQDTVDAWLRAGRPGPQQPFLAPHPNRPETVLPDRAPEPSAE